MEDFWQPPSPSLPFSKRITQMHAEFLRQIVLVSSFRGDDVDRVSAGLLLIGLGSATFNAGDLPGELVGDSKTLAGIATGRMIATGLLEVVGRVRSSSPLANGRKVNQLRVNPLKVTQARNWLAARGYTDAPQQMELIA